MDEARLSVYLPAYLKADLDKMGQETGLKTNQLVVMALHSLVKNYETKGSFIFVDLLNPSDDPKKKQLNKRNRRGSFRG
jgi:hypothetical protein